MPLNTLDSKTALIVVDLQAGSIGIEMAPHRATEVVPRASLLADNFRSKGLPVVLVNVAAAPGARSDQNPEGAAFEMPEQAMPLAPQLGRADKLITKRTPGAFTGTDLEHFLRSAGVTQVVVVGVATSDGVASTVQQAFELGFHVSVPLDAVSDPVEARHNYSVTHHFPQRAETGTTEDLLTLLAAS